MTDTVPGHDSAFADQGNKKRATATISCRICQATYAPSQEHHYLLQAPPMALESAFMSMCHFCFRCRRPACPQCWDNVHGVCGECCLEAQLPFRAQAAPLQGVLFATTRQAQLHRKHAMPVRLICIRPGRFQKLASIDTAETMPLQTAITRRILPTSTSPRQAEPHPALRNPSDIPIEHIPTRPPRPEPVRQVNPQPARQYQRGQIQYRAQGLSQSGTINDIDDIATQPPRVRRTVTLNDPLPYSPTSSSKKSLGKRVEQLMTSLLFTLLLVLLGAITLALWSADANSQILQLFHIDIRAEIAYLWQLINQLHH